MTNLTDNNLITKSVQICSSGGVVFVSSWWWQWRQENTWPRDTHWCILNLFSTILELFCGSSCIVCVLVKLSQGKMEASVAQNQFLSALVQHKCTVMGESMANFGSSWFAFKRDLTLFQVHHIGRTTTGEHTLLVSRWQNCYFWRRKKRHFQCFFMSFSNCTM